MNNVLLIDQSPKLPNPQVTVTWNFSVAVSGQTELAENLGANFCVKISSFEKILLYAQQIAGLPKFMLHWKVHFFDEELNN